MTRTPIWAAIATALRDDIAQGRYGVGDRLPTEATLAARFGVNRHTVRHATKVLAEEGRVHPRRGAGVFVTAGPAEYPIGRKVSFHRNLAAAGRMPGRKILALERRLPTLTEAQALEVSADTPVLCVEGVSSADHSPIAIFRSCFPGWLPDRFGTDLTESGSVTRALALSGVTDWERRSTRISACLATAIQAGHLRLREGAALIFSQSVNVTADGRPVEFGLTWFAGDRVTLNMQPDQDLASHF